MVRPPATVLGPDAGLLGQQLAAAVDALVDLNDAGVSTGAIGDLLVEVHRQSARLNAVALALTASFERRRGHEADGCRNVAHWLQTKLRRSPGDAKRQADTARRLDRDLTETKKALQDGQISGEHAAAIARTADDLPPDRIEEAERRLLGAARQRDPRNVQREGRRLSQAADRDAARHKAERAYQQRTFTLRDDGAGSVFVEGRLHQYAGEKLRVALGALCAPTGRDDTRTHGQRMADALIELVERAETGRGLPQQGGLPAHVLVTIPVEELDVRAGRPVGTTAGALGGELGWDGPALPPTFEQIVCEARLEWLITDPDGQPLRYGRTRTEPTPAQRRALHHRYGGCAWPRCTAPAPWTLIHHEPPVDEGGRTDVDAMVPLCARHHAMRHHGRWWLHIDSNGTVAVTAPDGTTTTQSPEDSRRNHQQRPAVADEDAAPPAPPAGTYETNDAADQCELLWERRPRYQVARARPPGTGPPRSRATEARPCARGRGG